VSNHAKLSPSKAVRWTVCPGSIREEAKYPDSDNESSIDGTRSHLLLSVLLGAGIDDASQMVGHNLLCDGVEFTVDRDRADRVQVALNYVAERRALYGLENVMGVEEKVNPAPLVGRADMSGTADITLVSQQARVLEVIDYKDGYNQVAAEANNQLEIYALGKLAVLPKGSNIGLVRMTIVQPKLSLRGLPPVSGWYMPVEYLLQRAAFYAAAGAATDAPDAPLVPGEAQCRFCKAKGACPALMEKTMTDVGVMFGALTSVPTTTMQPASILDVAASKEPTTLSNDKLREVIEVAPLLRQFLEAVEEEALRRIKAGQQFDGLKAVHGRGSRSWSLPEEEIAGKLTKMGIPKGSVYETKVISPAKAEKVTWTKRDGTVKQLTERQLKTMNEEYVLKSTGKLTVVSASDSRAAVEFNAAPLFAPIEAPVELPAWMK